MLSDTLFDGLYEFEEGIKTLKQNSKIYSYPQPLFGLFDKLSALDLGVDFFDIIGRLRVLMDIESKLADEILHFSGSLHCSDDRCEVSKQVLTRWAGEVLGLVVERDRLRARVEELENDQRDQRD